VALALRRRLGDAARGHEPHHAEHRVDPAAVACAADAVSRHVHPRVRGPQPVPPRLLVERSAGLDRRHGLAPRRQGPPVRPLAAARHLPVGTFRRVHVLPRRAVSIEAAGALPDRVLSHDLGGRCARRPLRRRRRAARFQRLFRARRGTRGGGVARPPSAFTD
jgi:hypothetical protein